MAVSYTHLDVYKRQIVPREFRNHELNFGQSVYENNFKNAGVHVLKSTQLKRTFAPNGIKVSHVLNVIVKYVWTKK